MANIDRLLHPKIELVEKLDDAASPFYFGESCEMAAKNYHKFLGDLHDRGEDWVAKQDELLTKSGCENL